MAQLREEELDLLIAEAAQLRTEHIVDADVLGVPTAPKSAHRSHTASHASWLGGGSRKVRDGERRVSVEVLGLDETLEQVPAHGDCLIGG